MKRLLYIISLVLFALGAYAQDTTAVDVSKGIEENVTFSNSDNDSIQAAIVAYNEGDFYRAIDLIEGEIKLNKKEGLESSSLYYNLGNAYFRVNELGKARLNYERAALLNPGDRDTRHNIEYLTTRIEDKILQADTLFLSTWFRAAQNAFNTDTWATIGVSFFLLFIVCLFAFFFTQQILIKKIVFYIGIVLAIFITFANIFAYRQKQGVENRDTAIIMGASVSVVSSPDINSKELFRLHVGTKVNITKNDRSWLEIEIDDGSVGWVQRDKIEII